MYLIITTPEPPLPAQVPPDTPPAPPPPLLAIPFLVGCEAESPAFAAPPVPQGLAAPLHVPFGGLPPPPPPPA